MSVESNLRVRSFTAGKRLINIARSPFPSFSSPECTTLNRLQPTGPGPVARKKIDAPSESMREMEYAVENQKYNIM